MTLRVGFALTTALGNTTRYVNLRKYVDRIPDVDCVWAPIAHHLEPDPYVRWPEPIHTQKVLNHEARAIFDSWDELDAVVVHAFQLHSYLTLYRRVRRHRPLLALYQDYAPFRDVSMLRAYGHDVRDGPRRRLRFALERHFTRGADVYFPWSSWAAGLLVADCGVDAERIEVVNVGVDLELWPYVDPVDDAGPVRLLFVGGDFERKGGDLLVEIVRSELSGVELDVVTAHAPPDLPPNVTVHTGLGPNDPRLRELYARADIFVLPTRADMSSIASIEAMATGRPVIATTVGGVPDVVDDGETGFLVDPVDGRDLARKIDALVTDAELRRRFGLAGRRRVERHLNAEVGAERLIERLSAEVAAARSTGT